MAIFFLYIKNIIRYKCDWWILIYSINTTLLVLYDTLSLSLIITYIKYFGEVRITRWAKQLWNGKYWKLQKKWVDWELVTSNQEFEPSTKVVVKIYCRGDCLCKRIVKYVHSLISNIASFNTFNEVHNGTFREIGKASKKLQWLRVVIEQIKLHTPGWGWWYYTVLARLLDWPPIIEGLISKIVFNFLIAKRQYNCWHGIMDWRILGMEVLLEEKAL